jgi:hypothetical protein
VGNDLPRPNSNSSRAIASGAKNIHQRRTDRGSRPRSAGWRGTNAAPPAKSRYFPRFHIEGFHDAVAGNGFVQNVLHVGQLILSAPGRAADAAADLARRKNDERDEEQQRPGQLPAQHHHQHGGKDRKVKNCCRNSASTLDMAYCTRSMSLMMVEIRVP